MIGIDAAYFLERLLTPPKEPLLSALGGLPLALEAIISKELDGLHAAGIKLHFVFDGLDCGVRADPFKASIESSAQIAKAFEIYEKDMANEAISVFRTSGTRQECFACRGKALVLRLPRSPHICWTVPVSEESLVRAQGRVYSRTLQCFTAGNTAPSIC